MISKDIFQLCNSIDEEQALKLDSEDYQANYKFDGERIIAIVIDNDVILVNRRGGICNFHFKEVVEDLKKLKNCIIDGEIISFDDDFNKLQRRGHTKNKLKMKELEKEIPVKYMVFDCLKREDRDIRQTPLKSRLVELQGLFNNLSFTNVELVEYKPISEMLVTAKAKDKEGLIIKDMYANYESKRTDNWKKLKFWCEGTIKVIKYSENPKGIRAEDSLGNAVQIAGEQSNEVKDLIDKQGEVEICIQYLEKTAENRFRFPSYRGLKTP